MESIGKVAVQTITFLGHTISFNPEMLYMTWLVMGIIIIISFAATRRLGVVPNKIQSIFEIIFSFLEEILVSTLGKKDGARFVPVICTLFVFILLSNWIGIIPNLFGFLGVIIALVHKLFGGEVTVVVQDSITNLMITPAAGSWYRFLFKMPAITEPTKYLSTGLGLAIIIFMVVHSFGIRTKGISGYFKSYLEPLPSEGFWLYLFFLNPFFYMNIISQFANTLSHSFRLFGNIFGGGIIIVIVSELLRYIMIPVGLFAFFGLFAGAIQAFVFTMLAVSYIAQQK